MAKIPADEKGSALVACIVIGLVFLAGVFWVAEWSTMIGRGRVHDMGKNSAAVNADTALNAAVQNLTRSDLNLFLAPNTAFRSSTTIAGGRYDYTLSRPNVDTNLIEASATGYYFLAGGTFKDPETGQNAQVCAVDAKYRVTNAGQFLIAVSTTLVINYGADATGGVLYGVDVVFKNGSSGPNTQVTTVYYLNSVYRWETSGNYYPDAAPTFVTFTGSTVTAQHLAYAPNFVHIDSNLGSYYSSVQSASSAGFGGSFAGSVSAAADSHVYYTVGDVHIGQGDPLVVNGVYVIYATGNIYIDNNVTLANSNSWVGFLSEQNIVLSADAPDNLTLYGNYLAAGSFMAAGPPRPGSHFSLTGGIVSTVGIDIANTWLGPRTYTFPAAGTTGSNSPDLLLPNFSELLEYKVVQGKY